MSDEVDDLLRRAMATLDRQVPSGYFDTLADRVAARLDASDGTAREVEPAGGAVRAVDAPEAAARAVEAPVRDELARERARRASVLPSTAASLPTPSAASSAEPARRPTWGRHLAVAAGFGVSVAAAVAVLIFITYEQRDRQKDTVALETRAPAAGDGAVARPGNAEAPAALPPSAAPTPPTPPPDDALDAIDAKVGTSAGKKPATATAAKGDPVGKAVPEPTRGKPRGKLSKLDKELPEAQQVNAKGVPSSLSKEDFQRGMQAVAAQARSCLDGARGTAALQVTVAPTGKVMRTVVSGDFAGTPVAACLQRAVAAATFPPWVGKPQRHAHSYAPSESK